MTTRSLACLAVALLVGPVVRGAEPAARPAQGAARKPNIVLLVSDDMGYADIGCHGCKDIPTPHIDSLAKNGVRCTDAYVSCPVCSPSRAGLLTGRYQQRFGHEFNPTGGPNTGLPLTEVTLADRLKAAGYATGLVGKWHLGGDARRVPTARGFQDFFGFVGAMHPYQPGAGKFPGGRVGIYRGTQQVQEKEYLTDAFAREAVAFIDRHQKEPFFLFLAFNAPHTPMQATEKYLKRVAAIKDTRRRTYAAMQCALDDAVGAVLGKLRAAGLEEHTLVIFHSDNGGPTSGFTQNGSLNTPLRGEKLTLYEGGIRVPFLLQWKGRLPAGATYRQPIIHLDIYPTALALAGVDVKPEWKLDGVNLLPHVTGKNDRPPHDALYWRYGRQFAIRQGDWKLVRNDNRPAQLYNLRADVAEKDDLSASQPKKFKELEAAWKTWDATLMKPLWGGRLGK